MRSRTVALPLLLAGLVLVTACGSSGKISSSSPTSGGSSSSAPAALHGSITVFAAASLTGSFTQLGRQFEATHPGTTVTFSFAASSTLAQQINQGAPADLFASAASTNMQQVVAAGGIASSSNFVSNTAELAVAPDRASTITSLSDLATSGVTFALCQVQVPCGALAQKVLDNAHVTAKPITQGLNVKTTLAYVTNGQVDAAIVYVTDVKAAGSAVVGVQIPAADNAKTEYPIGVVTASKHTALATAFERYVESSAGQSVLTAAGFSAP